MIFQRVAFCVPAAVLPFANAALQMRTLQKLLPGLDAHLLVARSPRLLSPNMKRILPARIAAMQRLLPGVDILRWAVVGVRLSPSIDRGMRT